MIPTERIIRIQKEFNRVCTLAVEALANRKEKRMRVNVKDMTLDELNQMYCDWVDMHKSELLKAGDSAGGMSCNTNKRRPLYRYKNGEMIKFDNGKITVEKIAADVWNKAFPPGYYRKMMSLTRRLNRQQQEIDRLKSWREKEEKNPSDTVLKTLNHINNPREKITVLAFSPDGKIHPYHFYATQKNPVEWRRVRAEMLKDGKVAAIIKSGRDNGYV
jgi:hypothetical protein